MRSDREREREREGEEERDSTKVPTASDKFVN